jgi:MFS family permease
MNLFSRLKSGGIVRAFRHRDFAIWSLASWCSDNGMWVMRIGMGWLTWELTHSGAWLGGIVLVQALPSVFLVPFAGALADRIDRVKIMRATQSCSVVLASGLCAMTLAGWVNEYMLLLYALVHGIVGTMAVPARVTLGPNLVPRTDISAAIAVGSVMFGSATFLGPALAGLIITQAGIAWTFAGNALGNILLVIALSMIRASRQEHHKSSGKLIDDIADGVRYVARHPGIRPTLILAAASSILVRPLQDLMPGFADTVFFRGAEGLATMMSAMGVGGMIGSFWIANRNRIIGTSRIFLWSSALYSLSTLAFAISGNFWAAVAALVVTGGAMSVAGNTAQILIQNSCAGTMRARVMSVYSYNYRTMPALGAIAMGAIANAVGFQIPVAVAAAIGLAAVAYTFRARRTMRETLEAVNEDTPAKPAQKAAAE